MNTKKLLLLSIFICCLQASCQNSRSKPLKRLKNRHAFHQTATLLSVNRGKYVIVPDGQYFFYIKQEYPLNIKTYLDLTYPLVVHKTANSDSLYLMMEKDTIVVLVESKVF